MDESPVMSIEDLRVSVRPRQSQQGPRVSLSIGKGDARTVVMAGHEATRLAAQLVQAAHDLFPPPPADAFGVEDFRLMAKLLRRYAETCMDQWNSYSLTTDDGPVYLYFLRSVADPDSLTSLDGFLAEPE